MLYMNFWMISLVFRLKMEDVLLGNKLLDGLVWYVLIFLINMEDEWIVVFMKYVCGEISFE